MALLDPSILEAEDGILSKQGVPLRYRPLDCFTKLYGPVPDGTERQALFDPILNWYLARYGETVRWDGVVGRFPILIKGAVYLGLARWVERGTHLNDWREAIESLPKEVAESVTLEEFRAIAERLAVGSNAYSHLYNLRVGSGFLGKTEGELVQRGLYDLENAALILKNSGDTQTTVFLAHQAAEKFLKAAVKRSEINANLKAFGHNLPKLIDTLIKQSPRFRWLKVPADGLQTQSPSMELRYGLQPRTIDDSVSAFHASLYICGSIALVWLFDQSRGSDKSSFKAGSFYINGMWETLYCKSIGSDDAILTLFTSHPAIGSRMVDLVLPKTASALYLEITDANEDARLRRVLIAHLRDPGKRVEPDEIGLKRVDGAEGSYATAMISWRKSGP